MANNKSAKKRILQSEKKRLRNKGYKSAMRTYVKKFVQMVEAKEVEKAKTEFPKLMGNLDRIARKGIFHPNNIARKKSQLHRMYKNLLAAPAPAPVADPS